MIARLFAPLLAVSFLAPITTNGSPVTTAWRDGQFVMNTAGVVQESDIVLGQPNTQADQAMPLGDGQLGAAVWAADGMTIQLNRATV